tara:strand:+ start:1146 stop:2624 length:1479 start_codon:yes stop_codon:yes gene_type:complete
MKKNSISPLNQKKYEIVSNEKDEILKFLSLNKDKEIIVVQGLGFVGTAMSLVCANSKSKDYAVVGLDLPTENSYWKVGMIKNGELPLESSDPNISKYFISAQEKKSFFATADKSVLKYADYVIVDVNLDVKKNHKTNQFQVQMQGFKNAIQDLGENCREDVLILVETTVPPGTCKNIVKPIIDKCFKLRNMELERYILGHSYERVMPGPNYLNSIKNFYRVYSAIKEKDAEQIEQFLKTLISVEEYPLTRLHSTQATEMAKVLENSYRAMNISFIVEWSRFAENAGIDLYEVVDAIRMRPTHSNMMYPGLGVGGYCLTKDPLIASWASQEFFNSNALEMSEKAVMTNDLMPFDAFNFFRNKITSTNKNISKIAILGVAYGPGIGDTRFSPVESFFRKLHEQNFELTCFDPYISYWEELNIEVKSNFEVIDKGSFDCAIITTRHNEFENLGLIVKMLDEGIIVYDTVGAFAKIKDLRKYKNYYLLGSGIHEFS